MGTRKIAAFDFDGTLTTHDTFIRFIAFVFGWKRLILGMLKNIHFLILMKLNLYPNWKAKQKVFSLFFQGMSYSTFKSYGESFALKIAEMTNQKTMSILKCKQNEGTDIYVITASIDEWIRPFCVNIGVNNVIATQIELDDSQCLTGYFATENCYGKEKVERFIKCEPNRSDYYLYAYGDSKGDSELLDYADESIYYGHDKIKEFIRFGIVGMFCTAIDAVVFYITNIFVNYQVSMITGYGISLIFNYFLTVSWTFCKKKSLGNAIGILAAHLINLFIVRMGLMHLFVAQLSVNPNIAYIPVLAISIVTNFFVVRFVVKY